MQKKPNNKKSTQLSQSQRTKRAPAYPKAVNISRLKAFVAENSPSESPLRIVLVDDDECRGVFGEAPNMAQTQQTFDKILRKPTL